MTDTDERLSAGLLRDVARCGRLEKRALPAYSRTDLIIFLTMISLSFDLMAPLLIVSQFPSSARILHMEHWVYYI